MEKKHEKWIRQIQTRFQEQQKLPVDDRASVLQKVILDWMQFMADTDDDDVESNHTRRKINLASVDHVRELYTQMNEWGRRNQDKTETEISTSEWTEWKHLSDTQSNLLRAWIGSKLQTHPLCRRAQRVKPVSDMDMIRLHCEIQADFICNAAELQAQSMDEGQFLAFMTRQVEQTVDHLFTQPTANPEPSTPVKTLHLPHTKHGHHYHHYHHRQHHHYRPDKRHDWHRPAAAAQPWSYQFTRPRGLARRIPEVGYQMTAFVLRGVKTVTVTVWGIVSGRARVGADATVSAIVAQSVQAHTQASTVTGRVTRALGYTVGLTTGLYSSAIDTVSEWLRHSPDAWGWATLASLGVSVRSHVTQSRLRLPPQPVGQRPFTDRFLSDFFAEHITNEQKSQLFLYGGDPFELEVLKRSSYGSSPNFPSVVISTQLNSDLQILRNSFYDFQFAALASHVLEPLILCNPVTAPIFEPAREGQRRTLAQGAIRGLQYLARAVARAGIRVGVLYLFWSVMYGRWGSIYDLEPITAFYNITAQVSNYHPSNLMGLSFRSWTTTCLFTHLTTSYIPWFVERILSNIRLFRKDEHETRWVWWRRLIVRMNIGLALYYLAYGVHGPRSLLSKQLGLDQEAPWSSHIFYYMNILTGGNSNFTVHSSEFPNIPDISLPTEFAVLLEDGYLAMYAHLAMFVCSPFYEEFFRALSDDPDWDIPLHGEVKQSNVTLAAGLDTPPPIEVRNRRLEKLPKQFDTFSGQMQEKRKRGEALPPLLPPPLEQSEHKNETKTLATARTEREFFNQMQQQAQQLVATRYTTTRVVGDIQYQAEQWYRPVADSYVEGASRRIDSHFIQGVPVQSSSSSSSVSSAGSLPRRRLPRPESESKSYEPPIVNVSERAAETLPGRSFVRRSEPLYTDSELDAQAQWTMNTARAIALEPTLTRRARPVSERPKSDR